MQLMCETCRVSPLFPSRPYRVSCCVRLEKSCHSPSGIAGRSPSALVIGIVLLAATTLVPRFAYPQIDRECFADLVRRVNYVAGQNAPQHIDWQVETLELHGTFSKQSDFRYSLWTGTPGTVQHAFEPAGENPVGVLAVNGEYGFSIRRRAESGNWDIVLLGPTQPGQAFPSNWPLGIKNFAVTAALPPEIGLGWGTYWNYMFTVTAQ